MIRLLASRGDLWLDEILSVELARNLTRPWDVVFAARAQVDNNHVLTTSWLYLFRDWPSLLVQRLLSVIAGTLSVAAAYWFARRWGHAAALFAAALFGGSFVMINYASEARGYAMLAYFTLLAIATIDRALQRRSIGSMLAFWIVCAFGILAHLLFIETVLAIVAWTVWRFVAGRDQGRGLASFIAQYHVVPIALLIGLYVVFIRHIQVLGANPSVMFEVLGQAAAFLLGFPRDPFWSGLALSIASAVVVIGLRALRRERDDSWVLMGMLCAGAPAVVAILSKPEFVLPRYFMVPMTGCLLLMALLLGRLFDRSRQGRVMSLLVLAMFVVANGRDTAQLLRDGRGQYSLAVRDMAMSTPDSLLRIGGDHEFRERTVLNYYRESLPAGRRLEYVPSEPRPDIPPEWVVMHSFDPEEVPATPAIIDEAGNEYRLFRVYPSGPLSGWYWYVYRK